MARGPLGMEEILETVAMVGNAHLDIRTVTLGVDLRGCRTPEAVKARVTAAGGDLVETGGVWLARPASRSSTGAWPSRPSRGWRSDPTGPHPGACAGAGRGADTIGVDFIGGLSALVEKHARGSTRS